MGPTWDKGVVQWPHRPAAPPGHLGPCGLGQGPKEGASQNPNPMAAGLGAKAHQPPALGKAWGAPLGHLYKEDQGGQSHPWLSSTQAAAPSPCRTTSSSLLSSSCLAKLCWISKPYPPHHRRCAADLASLSTNSCGIKIVESSSSCTCGSLGGVARCDAWIIHLLATSLVAGID